MKKLKFGLLAVSLLAFGGSASAGALYSNGPLNGQGDSFNFLSGYYNVSDSFTVSGAATVTSFDFAVWLFGNSLTSVNWDIGTTVGGSDIGSGSGAPSAALDIASNDLEYSVYTETISGLNVSLPGAGTYYLTLVGTTSDGNSVYWDENDGPSAGYQNGGTLANNDLRAGGVCANGLATCTGSETFDINPSATTPEPGSLMLFGSGMLLLAGGLRRKVRR